MKVSDNEGLSALFAENLSALKGEWETVSAPPPELPAYPAWFAGLYRGKLKPAQMPELGLFGAPEHASFLE